MRYLFITQDNGLFISADCFDATVCVPEGRTLVGRIDPKGVATGVCKGDLFDRTFYPDEDQSCLLTH
jgi:hypothetical protein